MKTNNLRTSYSDFKSTKKTVIQVPMQTNDSFNINSAYYTKLSVNIDAFSKLSEKIISLTDFEVKNLSISIIRTIYFFLQNANIFNNLNNYLSRLNIIEQDDSSALIEWNFQNFRIGFSVEPKIADSSYFIVSEDRSI